MAEEEAENIQIQKKLALLKSGGTKTRTEWAFQHASIQSPKPLNEGTRDTAHQPDANYNLLQMVQGHPLHFDDFIVACSVIEGVTPLGEIVQHTAIV